MTRERAVTGGLKQRCQQRTEELHPQEITVIRLIIGAPSALRATYMGCELASTVFGELGRSSENTLNRVRVCYHRCEL